MRLIIINKRTIYFVLIVLLVVILTLIGIKFLNRTKMIFNPDAYFQGNKDKIDSVLEKKYWKKNTKLGL